jgi:hypothetical protein
MKKLSIKQMKQLKGGGETLSLFCPTYYACRYYEEESGQYVNDSCKPRAAVNIVLPDGSILSGPGGCFCGDSPYLCFNEA